MTLLSDDVFSSANSALKLLWRDKVTITVKRLPTVSATGTDTLNKQTVVIATDVPCKLSLGGSTNGLTPLAEGDNLQKHYDVKIIMDNGIDVPAGAILDVTDANGVTTRYRRASGTYPSYQSHQEIAAVYDEVK